MLARNQFILITMAARGGALIDWQVFAYTVDDKMSRPAAAPTCAGCWQNKPMRVIYHAAGAAVVGVANHLSRHGGRGGAAATEGE